MFKYSNRSIVFIAIGIIAVLVVVVGSGILAYQYYYIPKQETKNSTIETELAGWKTYTNMEYGFEFKYPSSWSNLSENKTNNGVELSLCQSINESGRCVGGFFVGYRLNSMAPDWSWGRPKNIIVGGKDAIEFICQSKDCPQGRHISIELGKNNL